MTLWRDIESAPDCEMVLIYCPDAMEPQVIIAYRIEFEGDPDGPDWYHVWAEERGLPIDTAPTKWMPLPDPPEAP